MNFTITKVSDKNFTHFDWFKEMNFSNWEIVFNNTANTLILQMRNGAPFPRKEVLATDVIIKNGTGGTPETFTTNAEIRARLIELGYNALVTSDPSGATSWGSITGTLSAQTDLQTALDAKQATLTENNFGAFANGLNAKTTLVDADSTDLVDSADSNKAKKVTWLNVWNYIKGKADTFYQNILVSGTNIKTINGNSILGSGDLTISGGGGTSYSDLFPIHLIYQEANGFLSIGTNVLSFSGTQSLLVISPILYRKIVSASTANSTTSIRESSFNRISQNKGYYFEIRVKNEDASAISDVKYFYGLAETGTLGGNNPSTYTGSFIGMGSDNTDTNCCIYYKNFTTGLNTKIDLGASFPKSQTNEYLIKFYRLSGSNDTTYDIKNLTTSATATGLISCNPSTLTIHTQRNNSASAIVCGYAIQRIKVFIED